MAAFGFIKRFILCRILDMPEVNDLIIKGRLNDTGDYGDEWSQCSRCHMLIHRDNHMFGDGIWRHD